MPIGKLDDEASLERWLRDRIEQLPLNTVQGLPGRLATIHATLTEFQEEGLPPSGTAGGVLKGKYPNPEFAVDMVTQAELDGEKAQREGGDTAVAATAAEKLATHAADTTEIHGIADTSALALKTETVSKEELENYVEGPETSVDNAIVAFDGTTGKLIKEAPAESITGTLIASATIKGEHIANSTITAGKLSISELSAISAKLGTITSGSITGATLATAKEGARVEIDTKGIRGINAAAKTKFEFDTTSGILTATAVISAEEGSVLPTKYLAGQIKETQIEEEAVNTPQLVANAVTAAKISVSKLSAITADLGTITAGTITGAIFQTATSNPKIIFDEKGFRAIDKEGVATLNLEPESIWVRASTNSVPPDKQRVRFLNSSSEVTASLYGRDRGKEGNPNSEAILVAGLVAKEIPYSALVLQGGTKSGEIARAEFQAGSQLLQVINHEGASDLLQLATRAKRKINFGAGTFKFSASAVSAIVTVKHGLGVTPTAVVALMEGPKNSSAIFTTRVINASKTSESFEIQANCQVSTTVEFGFMWIAVG